MLRHAARALPWPLLAATAVLLYTLLRAVEQWPYQIWPLQGLAVGLIAGVAAYAYDEPAAAVVDTLPRGLAWRTAARSLGVLLLLGWWLRRRGRDPAMPTSATQGWWPGRGWPAPSQWSPRSATCVVVAWPAPRPSSAPGSLVGRRTSRSRARWKSSCRSFLTPGPGPGASSRDLWTAVPWWSRRRMAGGDAAPSRSSRTPRGCRRRRGRGRPRSRRRPGPRPPGRPRRGRAGRRCRP